ncbi:MAG: PspC domain-containing protein, partial [Ruminococcus sp.]|nr:PspC domain-containing protein [Ruminococcus sp.]
MGKTLYKIRQGRIISGVCLGLSEYLNLDVNVIRLLVVIFSCT